MTTQVTTRIMSAGITPLTIPKQDREEVNTVALLDILLFDMFRDAKRVPQKSDLEKAKRLESVRRRRQQQADKAAELNAFHGFTR